jgi:hypothetical protein
MKKWVITFLLIVSMPFLIPPLLVLMTGLFADLLSGTDREQWNQRLTLILDTPAGELRASAVTQITKTDTTGGIFFPPEARRVNSAVVGEAVVVEVTPGRWLFALLGGREDGKGEAASWVYPAFIEPAEPDKRKRSYARAMQIVRAQPLDTPAPLPMTDLPMLVTFDDVTRPETVRLVDPADLAATFGPGVRLRAVTLEVTEAAVTVGTVEGVLAWLRKIWPKRLDGQRFGTIHTEKPFANSLSSNSFVTEIHK